MKQMPFLFLFLFSGAQAASSSESCEKKVVHIAEHLKIEANFSAAQPNAGLDFAARYFPWKLAYELEGAMRCGPVHTKVAPHVTTALRFCEQKALENPDSKDWKINKILILIAIKRVGIALRVEGEADSLTCQTLFPPYTVKSEGDTEVPLENQPGYYSIGKAPTILRTNELSSGSFMSGSFKDSALYSMPQDDNWSLFGGDLVRDR